MKDSNYLLSQLISLYWAGWVDGNTGRGTSLDRKKAIDKILKKLAKRFKVKE